MECLACRHIHTMCARSKYICYVVVVVVITVDSNIDDVSLRSILIYVFHCCTIQFFSSKNLSPQNGKQKKMRKYLIVRFFPFGRSVHLLLSSFCWVQVHRVHIVFQNWILVWTNAHCDETPTQIAYERLHRTEQILLVFFFASFFHYIAVGDGRFLVFDIFSTTTRDSFFYSFCRTASERHGNKCVTYCVPFVQTIFVHVLPQQKHWSQRMTSEMRSKTNALPIRTKVNFSFVERSWNDVDARFSTWKAPFINLKIGHEREHEC